MFFLRQVPSLFSMILKQLLVCLCQVSLQLLRCPQKLQFSVCAAVIVMVPPFSGENKQNLTEVFCWSLLTTHTFIGTRSTFNRSSCKLFNSSGRSMHLRGVAPTVQKHARWVKWRLQNCVSVSVCVCQGERNNNSRVHQLNYIN